MSEQYTAEEMMAVAAARTLADSDICFVGIGLPSQACNLARLHHAPNITLIYESGTIAAKPDVLPLSIGDPELCETALTTVSVPETFRYWLQGGRITIGFLGAAQIDSFGNINTTVIGEYANPKVRLPGGGGAPEIATCCAQVYVVMRHSKRALVEKVDFVTSLGNRLDGKSRADLGVTTKGVTRLITDLCVFGPDESGELIVEQIHAGVDQEQIRQETGWPVRFADKLEQPEQPSQAELDLLRDLKERTSRAHA